MDLQERRQLDMAARMTKVRARARPWRSIIALVLAIAGGIAAQSVKNGSRAPTDHVPRLIWICGLAAFFVFGMAAAIGLSARARAGLQPLVGQAHAGVTRYVLLLVGVFAVLTVAVSIYGQSPDKWLLGGAVTGVLIGIAAQQSLANLFAGLVLLFASPFRVGDHVRFRAGALSGEIEGVVTDLSLTYVRLETAQGRMLLPNAQALAAAVLLVPEPHSAVSRGCLRSRELAGAAAPGCPLCSLVVRLVFRDDVRRNAAAITDFHSALLRPGPDIGTALPMRASPPLQPPGPAAYPPGLLGEPAYYLIELLAMPLAQVDLIIPAIKAERASHVLAFRNFF
jgi:hypothetical protein